MKLWLMVLVALVATTSGASMDDLDSWSFASWGNNRASSVNVGDYLLASISGWQDGDAKWYFDSVAVKANYRYSYREEYRSDVRTRVVAVVGNGSGVETYINIGYAAPFVGWTSFETVFAVPADAKSLTVYHLIESDGWLQTSRHHLTEEGPATLDKGAVSLNFDIDYLPDTRGNLEAIVAAMNGAGYPATLSVIASGNLTEKSYPAVDELKPLLNDSGFSVASHSMEHPHMWGLNNSRLLSEISGSRLSFLAKDIDARIFAYPYGEYDQGIIEAVKSARYSGARTSEEGFNFKGADPYRLYVHSVKRGVSASQIREWIDYAAENRVWLILVFYGLDASGTEYSVDPQVLTATLEYLKYGNIDVISIPQGIELIS